MSGLTIDVQIDFKDALKNLDAKTVERLATAALEVGGLLVANKAKELAPVKTGTLRRSIHVGGRADLTPDFQGGSSEYSDLGKPGALEVIVGTNLEYAKWQEYGTGPIRPIHAAALHWMSGGQDVFAMSTKGVPAHPFLTPAVNIERDNVLKEVGRTFNDLVAAEVAKG